MRRKLSPIAQDNEDARSAGLTYGQYKAPPVLVFVPCFRWRRRFLQRVKPAAERLPSGFGRRRSQSVRRKPQSRSVRRKPWNWNSR